MVRSMSRDNAASGCIPQPVIRIVRHIHPAALLRVERLAEGQGVARRAHRLCSRTAQTGELRRMIYLDGKPPGAAQRRALVWLEQHKERLLARKVTDFDESNGWCWGWRHFASDAPACRAAERGRLGGAGLRLRWPLPVRAALSWRIRCCKNLSRAPCLKRFPWESLKGFLRSRRQAANGCVGLAQMR